MRKLKLFVLYLLIMLIPSGLYYLYWRNDTSRVDIYFTTDGHGHIYPPQVFSNGKLIRRGGLAALKKYMTKKAVSQDCLLFDSGDFYQGGIEGSRTKGAAVIDIMNSLGYDAISLGNHDLDYGQDNLRSLAGKADFPVLCSNVLEKDTGEIPAYMKKYTLLDYNGVKLAVIGAITDSAADMILSDNIKNLEFIDVQAGVKKTLAELSDKNADLIILLSHMGKEDNMELSKAVPGLDVILCGHTHMTFPPELCNGALILQGGKHFQDLGILKAYYGRREDKIVSYNFELAKLKDDYNKEDISEVIAKYDIPELTDIDQVIGRSENIMPGDLFGEGKKHRELKLGNFVTDVIREMSNADMAFYNLGSLCASMPKGDITLRNLWEIEPFDNKLVLMTLKGEQIVRLLEQSASHEYSTLQLSGVQMIYNSSLPEGHRVLNVIIKEIIEDKVVKTEIDPEKEYRIATGSFLADGGDGYSVFLEGQDVKKKDVLIRDLMHDYIMGSSPVSSKLEKRLVNVSIEKGG